MVQGTCTCKVAVSSECLHSPEEMPLDSVVSIELYFLLLHRLRLGASSSRASLSAARLGQYSDCLRVVADI